MDAERWKRVEELLQSALQVAPARRDEFLQQKCSGDIALIAEIKSLLTADRNAGDFLQGSAINVAARSVAASEIEELAPWLADDIVPHYRILKVLGSGGMGSVWLAERSDGRFERRVAIKFLNLAMIAAGSIDRFRREGSILGRLAHPQIAELIDAGVTAKGEPYLILEYVDGQPIDEYCDQRALTVEARIGLFLDVLSAVSHAHTNLIVHRDIKPSNVLVRKDGCVKLLDFGIAKLLGDEAGPASVTTLTLESGSVLTPRFAAPEQITNGSITTATDVYALGVLLYVLLSGHHPAGSNLHSPAQLLRVIAENETPPLSSVISPGDRGLAAKHETTPDKLRRKFRGDLDTIVGKALKKDPAERYATVSAFSDDLQRYLKHEAISTRPDNLPYRARKFMRRNRIAIAVTAGLLILLAGFAVMQAVQLRRITRERDRADRITKFMTNMFKVSNPSEARGNNITAREILDKASKEIDTGLANTPEVQAQMMYVMGDVYGNLGLYSRAEPLLARALDSQRQVLGPEKTDTLRSESLLAWNLREEGHYLQAEKLYRETLDRQRRLLGPEHPDTLLSMSRLSDVLARQGRHAESEELARETFETRHRVLGPEHPETLTAMANLAYAVEQRHWYDGDKRSLAEAEELSRKALATQSRLLGPEHPDTLNSRIYLAMSLALQGRYSEAAKLEEETLVMQRRVLGPEHANTLITMNNLAMDLAAQGRYPGAEKVERETRDIQLRVLGPESPDAALSTYNLGCLAALQGHRSQALSLVRQAVDHGLSPSADQNIEKDSDLQSLHAEPGFAALVAHAKEKAAAAQNPK